MANDDSLSNTLTPQIIHALKQPIRKGLERLVARHYIPIYEQDGSHNKALLEFAKLDFNQLQSLHKTERSDISRWNIDFMDQLPKYVKPLYRALLDVYEEIEEVMVKRGQLYCVHYEKEAVWHC
ncbi:hypothetical protein ACSBR1_011575 [Camellia fascicularis]